MGCEVGVVVVVEVEVEVKRPPVVLIRDHQALAVYLPQRVNDQLAKKLELCSWWVSTRSWVFTLEPREEPFSSV